jgi:hypothetical protein
MSKFLKVFALVAMVAFGSVSSVNASWYKSACDEVSGGNC